MFTRIKRLKAVSIILAVIFFASFVFLAKRVSGLFFVAVILGIVTLFVLQAIALSKVEKELLDEKDAVSQEIRDLKKRIEKLEK
jgi:hypothetical protein